MHTAALSGDSEMMELLRSVQPMAVGERRQTLLHAAAAGGNTAIVAELLKDERNRADLSVVNKQGDLALHCAARSGSSECITVSITNPHPTRLYSSSAVSPYSPACNVSMHTRKRNSCKRMHTCIQARTHARMHALHAHACMHVRTHSHAHAHAYAHAHMYAHARVCTHAGMHVCTYAGFTCRCTSCSSRDGGGEGRHSVACRGGRGTHPCGENADRRS